MNKNKKISFFIDGLILRVKTEGSYAVDDFLNTIDEALNFPANPERFAIIIDGRSTDIDPTAENCERIMESLVVYANRITCFACVTLRIR